MMNSLLVSLFWVVLLILPVASSSGASGSGGGPNHLLHLSSSSPLKNDYYVLRHGQSLANVAKLIASSPTVATTKYGLSALGKDQAAQAGDDIIQVFQQQDRGKYNKVVLLSSDLLRAKETAQIVRDKLQQAGIPLYSSEAGNDDGLIIEVRLRERWFGKWDETSDANYHEVWKDDVKDPNHKIGGVESVNEVMDRVTRCIIEWDECLSSATTSGGGRCFVICVAHGDVLQILQTAFEKLDGSKHRTLKHLETATLRELELKL